MAQDFSQYANYLNLLAPKEPAQFDPTVDVTPVVPETFDPAHPATFAKYLDLLKSVPQREHISPSELQATTAPVIRQPAALPPVQQDNEDDDSDKATPTPVVQAPAPIAQKPLDFTGSSVSSNENLASALQAQGNMNLASNLGRSFDKIGSAIARTPDQENPVYKSIDNQAAQIPGQYQQLAANEKNDPNSQISKGFRSFVQDRLGTPLKGDPSAGDLERVVPLLFKDYEARLAEKGKLEQKKLELASKSDEKDKDRDLKKTIAEMVQGGKLSEAERKKLEHDEKTKSAALQQTQSFLETSRQDPAVRQAMLDKYNVQKAERIFKGKDLNNLSNQEVGLLVSEISKVARGGVPTQEELHAISPNTLTGKLSKVYSNLINEPTPARAGAFLKQYQGYLKELKANAENTISSKVKRVIEGKKKDLGDENYANLKDLYSDMLNPGDNADSVRAPQSNAAPSAEDQTAIDWANKNPKDPRAQQILKMHGM